MARGTEQQLALIGTERRIVGIDGYGVGRGFLHRERDVILDAETLLVIWLRRPQHIPEPAHVLGRNGEVYVYVVPRAGIHRTLDQMLLDGLAVTVGIGVEGDQTFGLVPVCQTRVDDRSDDFALVGAFGQHLLQLVPEGKTVKILQHRLHALAATSLVDELEQLLEHTRGGTRCRHELHDTQTFRGRLVTRYGTLRLILVEHPHAVAGRGRAHDLQIGEPVAEILYLTLHGLQRKAVLLDLQ